MFTRMILNAVYVGYNGVDKWARKSYVLNRVRVINLWNAVG